MKKIISVIIIFCMVLVFAGCTESTPQEQPEVEDGLSFSVTNLQNQVVTEQDFKDAKLILLNFWEPWCGPCVGEMPGLQGLYEKYKDEGFVVIGVFSTFQMEDEVIEFIQESGIHYPILRCDDENLQALCDGTYPTSYFLDGQGHMLSDEPIIGALDESNWEAMILEYLR